MRRGAKCQRVDCWTSNCWLGGCRYGDGWIHNYCFLFRAHETTLVYGLGCIRLWSVCCSWSAHWWCLFRQGFLEVAFLHQFASWRTCICHYCDILPLSEWRQAGKGAIEREGLQYGSCWRVFAHVPHHLFHPRSPVRRTNKNLELKRSHRSARRFLRYSRRLVYLGVLPG